MSKTCPRHVHAMSMRSHGMPITQSVQGGSSCSRGGAIAARVLISDRTSATVARLVQTSASRALPDRTGSSEEDDFEGRAGKGGRHEAGIVAG
jgi:hypothetical protein